ncbi:MAG: LicD family protein [Lachnospiraceae bacterium]|nr:LicD family protein [Lachnospiraceae bacterium]
MHIPEEFFESEVRSGFYISAEMKRGWAAQLDILGEISDICFRHSLKWWMDWGSMLGVVRHGGFTPWDDDIDISMMRDDYMAFIEAAPKELPQGYRIFNTFNTPDYYDSGTRVANNATVKLDNEVLGSRRGIPYIAGIDVICIDYISKKRDAELRAGIKEAHDLALLLDPEETLSSLKKRTKPSVCPEIEKSVREVENRHHVSFVKDKPLGQQLFILTENIMMSVLRTEAEKAGMVPAHAVRNTFKAIFPIEYYEELILLPFEFLEVPVPLHYDEMLKKIFGNYMRPYRAGGTHNYPFYADQEQVVFDQTGYIAWEKYKFKAADLHLDKIWEFEDQIPLRADGNRFVSEAHQDVNRLNILKEQEMIEKTEITEKNMDVSANGGPAKDVLFLIAKAENWVFMDKFYRDAVECGDNVYVIPIPYFYRTNTMGLSEEVHYEGQLLAGLVPVTGFDQYDYYGKNPDVVYFDTPYDLYDAHIAVHPMFFTDKIRQFAKKMIYVSCILVDEYDKKDLKAKKMMEFCINTPGVARADEVIVQSETIRQRYIDSLSEWAGEETRDKWAEKIKPTGLTQDELKEFPPVPDEELAPEWLEILYKK